jgi:putative PIG3 family NAD(P)H quinone oxidoreductase
MLAIAVEGDGQDPRSLKLTELERPRPGSCQVLIRVHAAGANRPDILQRRGLYPPPPGAPETLGLEVAGEIAEVGPDAPRWKVGDRVTALLGGGGYAQYAIADARHALPIPSGLNWEEAASLPETVFTVWANVFDIARLSSGETLLVHGATSGIGVTAIQMGKAAGARVITTSRGAEKAAQAQAVGADIAVDSTAEDFASAVAAAGGADVVLDMVGGDYLAKNIACMNPLGRCVMIAVQGGARGEADLAAIMRKRLVLTGSTLRPRDADEKARQARDVEANVWPWIEAGRLKPVVDRVFPLAQASAAHAYLDGDHVGKVVLRA